MTKHFTAQSALDIRHKIQKASAGPQASMNDLFQLAYSAFNNRELSEKAEHTQRNMQKAQMTVLALSTQRLPKGNRFSWWATRLRGTQTRPGYPVQTKGALREDCNLCVLCKEPGHWKREYPRCQSDVGLLAIDGFTVKRLKERTSMVVQALKFHLPMQGP